MLNFNRMVALLCAAVILFLLIIALGLSEDNDYSLKGIEETVLTVQAIPTTMALEKCFDLCDYAFEKFSEDNLSCIAQCKGK